MPSLKTRTNTYKPALAWFCMVALVWTTFLLYAGGFTTSIQAGMAFLDWPLSHGSVNPEGWIQDRDMRAEHSHRLLGTFVGMLTLTLCLWLYLRESRRNVRILGFGAIFLVILQGALGGARVLYDQLNTLSDHNMMAQTFAIAHACLAQIFVCLLVMIAASTSRSGIRRSHEKEKPHLPGAVRFWAVTGTIAIFLQLIVGAIMRHNHAGLAIPSFPWSTADGGLLPALWSFHVSIHFAHRVGAILVTLAIVILCVRIWRSPEARRVLGTSASALFALVLVQFALGALTVLTTKNPHVATLHVIFGAFLLATCWLVTFISYQFPIKVTAEARAAYPARSASGAAVQGRKVNA
ncbi:MAG: COX15/CtaA family protein [Opitutales bacterium]